MYSPRSTNIYGYIKNIFIFFKFYLHSTWFKQHCNISYNYVNIVITIILLSRRWRIVTCIAFNNLLLLNRGKTPRVVYGVYFFSSKMTLCNDGCIVELTLGSIRRWKITLDTQGRTSGQIRVRRSNYSLFEKGRKNV